jgi:hypothetical protein
VSNLGKFTLVLLGLAAASSGLVSEAFAHNVSDKDAALIAGQTGWQFGIYVWLGAKHMVTGYDHLLFLIGVIFYLRELRSIATFVSLFALGHSITLISGVALSLDVNAYLVDAIIGLSVAYKGFDNLDGFNTLFGDSPNEKMAVFIFGLFHGLGLATKLQDLGLSGDGLFANLVSFNLGVELGQLAALVLIVLALRVMPGHPRGSIVSMAVNVGLIAAGSVLIAFQLMQYAYS